MASVRSLGIYEPSALQYLIAEGLLPKQPVVHEEILTTKSCAIWSKNGAIKRLLNLAIEQEDILTAFATSFPKSPQIHNDFDTTRTSELAKEPALVVLLARQVHVLLLSGDSHILPLSFEVTAAFPCASGFILQRKASDYQPVSRGHDEPHHYDLSTINESQSTLRLSSGRPSLNLPQGSERTAFLNSSGTATFPRTYCCTDFMSDFGLVVQQSAEEEETLDACPLLSPSQELLYISRQDEFSNMESEHQSLSIALTRNHSSGTITIWRVASEVSRKSRHRSSDPKKQRKSTAPKRKSSNIYGRLNASNLAGNRANALRESFGAGAQSLLEQANQSSNPDKSSLDYGDLVNQLGPEFEQSGVQTRSARRVSSMLARTDLAAGNDRNTFLDLGAGHGNRKSLNVPSRKEGSIGGFSDRHSLGPRSRVSFPMAASVMSNEPSFADPAGKLAHGRLDAALLADGFDLGAHLEPEHDLTKEIGFFKVTSFSMLDTSPSPQISSQFDINVLAGHDLATGNDNLSVCIVHSPTGKATIVNLVITHPAQRRSKKHDVLQHQHLEAISTRQGTGVVATCLLWDHGIRRRLLATTNRQAQPSLRLDGINCPPFTLELPDKLFASPSSQRVPGGQGDAVDFAASVKSFATSQAPLCGLETHGLCGGFLIRERQSRMHLLCASLAPTDSTVNDIITLSNFLFSQQNSDSLLVAFWEVRQWLQGREDSAQTEWSSMIVAIFALAVPFMSNTSSKSDTPSKRRKAALLRSSSGAAVDLTHFNSMIDSHSTADKDSAISHWSWLSSGGDVSPNSSAVVNHRRSQSTSLQSHNEDGVKDRSVVQCVGWAREFAQSPQGEAALGPEGYLPTSVNKDRDSRKTALAKLLVGMHLLYQEYKLDHTRETERSPPLSAVLAQIGTWLGWPDWTLQGDHGYAFEIHSPDRFVLDDGRIDGLDVPSQLLKPPSIFEFLSGKIGGKSLPSFPTLDNLIERKHAFRLPSATTLKLTPKTSVLISILSTNQPINQSGQVILRMKMCGIDTTLLQRLPGGIAMGFFQATTALRSFTGQHALAGESDRPRRTNPPLQIHHSHNAGRDYHNASESAFENESLPRWDTSSEADRQSITRLLFHEDRRFQEASRLVNQTRAPTVECTRQPQWSEADLLEAQKELVQHITRRTLAVASGRALMHFNARIPLLTERVPIPAFSLQCSIKSRSGSDTNQAVIMSADKASFTEDKVCWAFFHNGASAGLVVSRDAKCIDTSWILYNKPPELTNRHAGLLLALGLNGHLKTLAKWVAFKYLTPKHTMTAVGLLLGLAASYIGTQDQHITRLMSVHVTRLLPPGAAELNLSPLTQTTGIMGIGLLYHSTQHRRMSEIMLSEIENADSESEATPENLLRDESYRLASGFSLGLINLGQGKRLRVLQDIGVTERLLAIAVGNKNVNLVHILDRATAGAVMAVAFIHMKTNDVSVASKIDVPDTLHQFDYVRPDIFLLRTLARHLIMWGLIAPTPDFVASSLPSSYRSRASLETTKELSTEDMPFFNIVAGICFAMALRFAGSQRHDVRDLLIHYVDQFLRLSRLPCEHYDAQVTLNSVRNCLDMVALSTATVMAGSGDLLVLRRLRSLHGRTDKDTPFGSHMAAHIALGALFLGGGTMTFGTSNLATAALCISFYPLFPSDVLDNKAHLQALRHLWVLAVEGRCLIARSRETGHVVGGVEGLVTLKDGRQTRLRAPGLLPDFDTVEKIEVAGEGWWNVTLDLKDKDVLRKVKSEGANVLLERKARYDVQQDSVLLEELKMLDEVRQKNGAPSMDPNVAARTHGEGVLRAAPLEWLFGLKTFTDYDYAERELLLGLTDGAGKTLLDGSVLDARLEMERGCLPDSRSGKMARDQLWQIRLLLDWSDKFEQEDAQAGDAQELKWASGTWLRREVAEKLRSRVWEMAQAEE